MKLHLSLTLPRAAAFVFTWLCSSSLLSAGPHADIVIGPEAPKLERFAAEELAAQLTKLYGADAAVVEKAPAGDAPLVLVGSPTTNPATKQAAGDGWPKLSDQGHLLRSVKLGDRDALLVGGGSPRATLWAAYELGYRLGIRYLLSGDVYPAEPGELKLSGYDVLLEPSLKDRTWVGMGAEPIGLSAWGLEDQKRLLGQLAKLKFNRVVLRFEPWQPFVDFECHGVHKRTAQLWQRESWPIDGETPGRAAFHGAKEFSNPDFPAKADYEAKTKAGIALARGVLQRARELGMRTGIALAQFEFPSEFAGKFHSRPLEGMEKLAVRLSNDEQFAGNEATAKAVYAQVGAFINTYSEVDAVYLAPARIPGKQWTTPRNQLMPASALALMVTRPEFFSLTGANHYEGLIFGVRADVDKRLEPFLRFVTGRVIRLGPSIHDVLSKGNEISSGPVSERNTLLLPLVGDRPQLLPQASLDELDSILKRLRTAHWSGFAVECGVPGDLEPDVFYLARVAFDDRLTPEAACEDLVAPICGPATSERLLLGFRAAERAAFLAHDHDPSFTTPDADMVMKHYTSDAPAPEWWKDAKEGYLTCMTESLRAKDRSLLPGRPWLRYVGKRMEFAYEYMNSIEHVQLAGAAKRSGDAEAQLEHLEAAVEAMYNALHALGEVAADPSDRGVIAVLAEYGYRPLVAEFEKVQDEAE